jgi:hypothetical protein
MTETTLATKIKKWQTLADQARAMLAEIPTLTEHLPALEAATQEVRVLDNEAQGIRARRLTVYRERREAEARCIEARGRVAAALVTHFGPQSERLVAFGVGPRPRKLRRKKPESKPAPETTSAPAQPD